MPPFVESQKQGADALLALNSAQQKFPERFPEKETCLSI
jgi:hypothetical protein